MFRIVVQLENERFSGSRNPTFFVPGKICVAPEGFTEVGFYQSYCETHVVAFRMEGIIWQAVTSAFVN
jgi:hypothetical protein